VLTTSMLVQKSNTGRDDRDPCRLEGEFTGMAVLNVSTTVLVVQGHVIEGIRLFEL